MRRRNRLLAYLLALALMIPLVACQPPSPPAGSSSTTVSGNGTLTGVVTDDPVTKPPGTAAKTYPGISVIVHQAVAAGSYRTSAEAPMKTAYQTGPQMAETLTGKDGRFSLSLPPGFYMVRGAGGEKIYASGVLAEIKAGQATEITLHLNFGV